MAIIANTLDEKAQRIVEFLTKELHLPKGLIRCKIVIALDELIKVTDLEYIPED